MVFLVQGLRVLLLNNVLDVDGSDVENLLEMREVVAGMGPRGLSVRVEKASPAKSAWPVIHFGITGGRSRLRILGLMETRTGLWSLILKMEVEVAQTPAASSQSSS